MMNAMNEKIDTLTDIICNLWRELGKLSTTVQEQKKEIEQLKEQLNFLSTQKSTIT